MNWSVISTRTSLDRFLSLICQIWAQVEGRALAYVLVNGMGGVVIGLLCAACVLSCVAYSAYERFQWETYGRVIPNLWSTSWSSSVMQDFAFIEMLLSDDPRMPPALRRQVVWLRVTLVAIVLAVMAYVFGWNFPLRVS